MLLAVENWPDFLDAWATFALLGLVLAVVVAGYAFMVLDFRAYLRLVDAGAVAGGPLLPPSPGMGSVRDARRRSGLRSADAVHRGRPQAGLPRGSKNCTPIAAATNGSSSACRRSSKRRSSISANRPASAPARSTRSPKRPRRRRSRSGSRWTLRTRTRAATVTARPLGRGRTKCPRSSGDRAPVSWTGGRRFESCRG